MIKGLTIKQHYDACIETWNWVAENNEHKNYAPVVLKYEPQSSCFACEVYSDSECKGCPLNILDYKASCEDAYPYKYYFESILKRELPKNLKEIAIDIAQIFITAYEKL